MRLILLSVIILLVIIPTCISNSSDELVKALLNVTKSQVDEVDAKMGNIIKILAQTFSWFQHTEMERKRAEGDSGLMQVRNTRDATRNWMTNLWARRNGQAAVHNHANNIRTVGMGEFNAVMNGVQFRTRHNDYRLNMPSKTSTKYSAVEELPFPEVPPSILATSDLPKQVLEMREYFKAWATQDPNYFSEVSQERIDYRPYFKPVLSYMQGMWTIPDGTIDEPFFSDRHKLAAESWFELQQKVMFNTLTGRKDLAENVAVLPTMVYDVAEDGTPRVAQWNYKILTHPLKQDIPLARFRVKDDLAMMMRAFKSIEEFATTRNARFELSPDLAEDWSGAWGEEKTTDYETYLEEIMYEVPGMDNYPANHKDAVFGEAPLKRPNGAKLNAGYYHRYYSLHENDASGLSKAGRSFADRNLWVALNNQSKIAPIQVHCDEETCEKVNKYQRVSYALPLEILWLTPLQSWNPYNLPYWHEDKHAPQHGGRDGDSEESAYNGTSSIFYYRTPAEMFQGEELGSDAADTVQGSVWVLDEQHKPRKTVASGMRVFLPNIPGVGSLRTRYPIFPVHQEGDAIYKELNALKDLVRKGAQYAHLYDKPLGGFSTDGTSGLEVFDFRLSKGGGETPHTHTFELTANQIMAMKEGAPDYHVKVETSIQSKHSHTLILRMRRYKTGVWIWKCDGVSLKCFDGHSPLTECADCPLGLLEA